MNISLYDDKKNCYLRYIAISKKKALRFGAICYSGDAMLYIINYRNKQTGERTRAVISAANEQEAREEVSAPDIGIISVLVDKRTVALPMTSAQHKDNSWRTELRMESAMLNEQPNYNAI